MIERQGKKSGRKMIGGDQGASTQFPLKLYERQMLAIELLCKRNLTWRKADAVRHLINLGIANDPGLEELR